MTEIGEPAAVQIEPEKSPEENVDWGMYVEGKPDENSPPPDQVKQVIRELAEKFGPPYNELLASIIVHEGLLVDVDPDWVGYFIYHERMVESRRALADPLGEAALALMKKPPTPDQRLARKKAYGRLRLKGRSQQAKPKPKPLDRSEEPGEPDTSVLKPHAASDATTIRKDSAETDLQIPPEPEMFVRMEGVGLNNISANDLRNLVYNFVLQNDPPYDPVKIAASYQGKDLEGVYFEWIEWYATYILRPPITAEAVNGMLRPATGKLGRTALERAQKGADRLMNSAKLEARSIIASAPQLKALLALERVMQSPTFRNSQEAGLLASSQAREPKITEQTVSKPRRPEPVEDLKPIDLSVRRIQKPFTLPDHSGLRVGATDQLSAEKRAFLDAVDSIRGFLLTKGGKATERALMERLVRVRFTESQATRYINEAVEDGLLKKVNNMYLLNQPE